MRQTPPEILIASLLLLGNDFLVIARLFLGADPTYTWIWGGVFGLILLWFIIRKEPAWKIVGMGLAGAISYMGGPVGFIGFLVCLPGKTAAQPWKAKEEEDSKISTSDKPGPMRDSITPRRLSIGSEGVRLDHEKNSINLK
jgi:hypothetical protein